MKSLKLIFVALCVSLFLVGCGKSEEAIAVEHKITAIKTVTLDSKPAIDDAQSAYDALEERQKKYVENYADIQTALETYNKLAEEKAAADDLETAMESSLLIADVATALDAKNTLCLRAWKWTDDTSYPETWEDYEGLSGKFQRDMGFSKQDLINGIAFALHYKTEDIIEHVDGLSFCSFLQNPAKGVLVSEHIWERRKKDADFVEDEAEAIAQAEEMLGTIDSSREYLPKLQELLTCVKNYLDTYGDCMNWSGTYEQNLKAQQDFRKEFAEKYNAVKDLGLLTEYDMVSSLNGEAVE